MASLNSKEPFLSAMAGVIALVISCHCANARSDSSDWSTYGGGPEGTRYSALSQVTKNNVKDLQQAWMFNFDELGDPQTQPLAVRGVIFAYTPSLKVIALDGTSGKQLWQFDSGVKGQGPQRGLAYWTDGKDRRLLVSVVNYLYALDPATGKPITEFGDGGRVDLRVGLGGDISKFFVSLTSPGVIYKDTIIVGFRTSETAPAPPGDIRAFDVRSGKLRWTFHTIPHEGEFGSETWPKDAWKTAGGANNWAGMVLDEKRGIVYAATGSAVNDFYGANRLGNDLFADTLLALDAKTGKRLWHFQGMHHDIMDRDFPSPPVLLTLLRNGKKVDAIAQATKQGFLFLFNRVTGRPLFPIEERPVPASSVPGEISSPTQPFETVPAPYARQDMTEDMVTNRTPETHDWALEQFRTFRSGEGPFTPMSVGKQTVVLPGFDGGAEWGGEAADPHTGVIYINANDIAWTGGLVENTISTAPGQAAYERSCAGCHGENRTGSPPAFPSLVEVGNRLTDDQITILIHEGRGRMPAFANLQGRQLAALLDYIKTGRNAVGVDPSDQKEAGSDQAAPDPSIQLKYRFTGYRKFMDPDGYPAIVPPWGTLNAIDLNTGKYLWKIPLGEYPDLVSKGLPDTGSENYGGPIITKTGVLFIGATIYDKKLRAFESATGKLLWETKLPYAGVATPITYLANGKQYILIETNNARDRKSPQGAAYVAFALP
jgi:quinoprotein glucose dehydrogenase